MTKSDSQRYHSATLKKKVYVLLAKNPLLSPKMLCQLLEIDYKKRGDYVNHIKTAWRYDTKLSGVQNVHSHAWRGFVYVPPGLDRALALRSTWIQSRARNKWLLFKDPLGRLQWFETDRVNIYVKKPGNYGRAAQLFCRGFSWTRIIKDIDVLSRLVRGIKFKGAHYVFETGERLPGITIDLFGPSSGIVVKLGDRSHPTGIEFLVHYPDWQERNERLLSDLLFLLGRQSTTNFKRPKPDYSI